MYAAAAKDEARRMRLLKFMERMHLRYLATSTRAQLIHAPDGTGHMFPYEAPDFVLDLVRSALAESSRLEETPRG